MTELAKSLAERMVTRRGFLRFAAKMGAVLMGPTLPFAPNFAPTARAQNAENVPTTEAASPSEILEQPAALEQCQQLFAEGKLTKSRIGWIDSNPVSVDHIAYTGVINRNTSFSFDGNPTPFVGDTFSHGTLALQFATQQGFFGPAGLSQSAWTEISFVSQFPLGNSAGTKPLQDISNYRAAIEQLVQTDTTVIGTIPTWRDSDIDEDSLEQAYVTVREAFATAKAANVIVVIPAGNANADLSTVTDRRILHEVAKEFDNVFIAGGVNQTLQHPVWGDGQGSNVGEGYISICSIATNRTVPSGEEQFISFDGTTFCVGDVVSLIAVLQNLYFNHFGTLPDPKFVLQIISETGLQLLEDNNHSTCIQMNNAITSLRLYLEGVS